MRVKIALLSSACLALAGCHRKQHRCEAAFARMAELAVRDAKDQHLTESEVNGVKEAMPKQKAAWVEACQKHASSTKIDCMINAKTRDDADGCMKVDTR